MRILHLLYFFFFFFSTSLLAQQDYQFLGVIKLEDSTIISYKISFTENKGAIKGHSITDLNGAHETKSLITGKFEEAKKLFQFKENGIVYTKSPITETDFCYINFTGHLKRINEQDKIEGSFKGLYNDGQECISGEIELGGLAKITKKAKKIDRKIDRNIFVKKKTKKRINVQKTLDTLNMNIINKGETLNIFSKDKKLSLAIYDAGKEDGDIINLSINGEKILDNFTVTHKKKIIPITVDVEKTLIQVEALNAGTSPPNTVRIEVTDTQNFVRTLTNLSTGEKASLAIIKKK